MDRSSPKQTFWISGGQLLPVPLSAPSPDLDFRRIIVLNQSSNKANTHCGPWNADNNLLTQYKWEGGQPILNTTTALLRTTQAQCVVNQHPTI